MSDNKLKIRIQIQQPTIPAETGETETTEQSIPDIDMRNFLEKPPFDWRKISAALFVLLVVIWIIGYLSLGQVDENTNIDSIYSKSSNVADPNTNFNNFGNDSVKPITESQQDVAANADNRKTLPDISDLSAAAEYAMETESNSMPDTTPDSKTGFEKKTVPPVPAMKPESVENDKPLITQQNDDTPKTLPSTESDAADHPQVLRAQLTHAIKNREPVDKINHVHLEQNKRNSIYFFVELLDLAGQQVTVNWYYQDQPVTETKLHVGGKNWRTYASKLLNTKSIGLWRAVLTDKNGKQLSERHFVVSNHS